MKKVLCFSLLFVFAFSTLAFAGAVKPITEPIPVEEEIAPPPPPPPPPEPSAEPLMINKYPTRGIGLGGNVLIGTVEKDELALYPQTEYGFNCLLGFGMTWFSGQPSAEQIRGAAAVVKEKYGDDYGDKSLAQLIREELGVKTLKYTTLGTALLLVPVNAEIGTVTILSDTSRFRLGFGIPTLISFGWSWDF